MNDIDFDENTIIKANFKHAYYPIDDIISLREGFKDMFKPPSTVWVTAEWMARFNNPISFIWLLEYAKVFAEYNNKKKVVKKWKIERELH